LELVFEGSLVLEVEVEETGFLVVVEEEAALLFFGGAALAFGFAGGVSGIVMTLELVGFFFAFVGEGGVGEEEVKSIETSFFFVSGSVSFCLGAAAFPFLAGSGFFFSALSLGFFFGLAALVEVEAEAEVEAAAFFAGLTLASTSDSGSESTSLPLILLD